MYSRIPAPCTLLLERLIKQVSTLIILSSEMGSIDLEHQRIVFVEMYQVTVHASTAFTANEKILEVYFKWAVKNSISALGHGLAAIVHLRDLSAYGAAHANALTLSKAATEAALALPRDTIWKQIGRSLNIVKSPPPEILKEQLLTQAGKLGNDASKLAGQRMMSGALTAITIGFFVYDVWQIVSVNDKMTYTNAGMDAKSILHLPESIKFEKILILLNFSPRFVDANLDVRNRGQYANSVHSCFW
jgi:hypothetical protein